MYEANDEYNPPYEGPYDRSGKTFPVASYDHNQGCSVTGGHVYRGVAFPSLAGRYFYGDFCSGRVFSMYDDPDSGWNSVELLDTPHFISTFGEDEDGELYLANRSTGVIYKLTYDEPFHFADMPVPAKEWMEPWVNAFYAHGITIGCGNPPLIYCPENNVTRAEMAVFVLRALHGGGYAPPPGSGVFADVPVTGKEWMEPWIIQFYNEGITTGCGGDNYCPENNVTRAEMAVFIGRAFSFYP
jgi:hypothetical protein